jgi:DNA segregation ATPase FtsK/SpoIIIE, S-DNA-T family
MWRLGICPTRDSALPAVDVEVRAQPQATVGDLAAALGQYFTAGNPDLLLAPADAGVPWPASLSLLDSNLRSGDLLEVVPVPTYWLDRPASSARWRATLRVVSGPDAGLEVRLRGETATIGRADSCTVVLTDPMVSRRHARLLVNPQPVLVDDGSAHGTTVSGVPVTKPTALEYGVPIGVGESVLVLEADRQDPVIRPSTGVLRPPTFGEPLAPESVEITAPPSKSKPPNMNMLAILLPATLGVFTFLFTHSPYSLLYSLGYPLLMLFGQRAARRKVEKDHRKALKAWYTEASATLDRMDAHARAQHDRAVEDHPDGPELRQRVAGRHPGLWSREPGADNFLACRIGLGPVPALMTGTLKDGGDPPARATAMQQLESRTLVADMPILLPLAESPVTAVVGAPEVVDGVLRAMLLRLCYDHSPADVSIAGIFGERRAPFEAWLRWVPHTGRRIGGLPPIAFGPVDGAALLDQLATDDGNGVTICIVDSDANLPRRQIEAVARAAGEKLRLIQLAENPRTVAAATGMVLDLTWTVPANVARAEAASAGIVQEAAAVLARRDRAGVERVTAVDVVSVENAWRTARAMTAYTDEVAVLPADTAIPESTRLPEVISDVDDPDSVDAVLARWRSRKGLRAPIGFGVDGVVTVDLREDGPHGLVAGTTGSGKSELLQTLICALALSSPPERVSFLLVDYKGGAAFRECADLPHTVGYITDLTPALVTRALTSLYAEVAAREELLAEYGAKDLIALERDHPDESPPSLLICVDEFAALTAEVPTFVDGMVNIAQRGRSLGMHLILATQRPAGVITPQIRANTDLRIALRVASTDDSNDVINRPDAAMISRRTPGRAWLRRTGRGTDELVQVAWVGARAPIASAAALVEVRPFSASLIDEPTRPAGSQQVSARTDLDRLVVTIGEAFIRTGNPPPRKPFLPALPPNLGFGATDGEVLLGVDAADAECAPGATQNVVRHPPGPGQVPIGLLDQPSRRAQPPLVLDYPQVGHVLVYGTSGSGKTELLRTLAISATLSQPDLPPVVYGIDFGGGGLATLKDWPTVGAIVSELEIGRVLRLLRMLRQTVSERNQALTAAGVPDLAALAAAGQPRPRIHIVIDNMPSLLEALDGNTVRRQHGEMLSAILADGRRAGVHVTAASPRRAGIPSAMQAPFGERIVLRMTTDDDYSILGAPGGILTPDSPPGRGLLGRNECQIATIGVAGTPDWSRRFGQLAAKVTPQAAEMKVAVRGMPTRVPYPALPAPEGDRIAIGLESEFLSPVTIGLTEAPLLIGGRSRSGRTTMLLGLAALARRSTMPPQEIVLIGPRADDVAGDIDLVVSDPAEVADAVADLRTSREAGEWGLLLVDDAHIWERAWESGGAAKEAVVALASLVDAAAECRLAVVVSTDIDEARSRQFISGVVSAAKRGRRGVLLQPDFSDGAILSANVPTQTSEPLTGTGRGLYCASAQVQVIQAVGLPEESMSMET